MNMHSFFAAILTLFTVSCTPSCTPLPDSVRSFSVQETQTFLTKNSDAIVLDVRTQEEFQGSEGHLQKAILLPLQELESRIHELQSYKSKPIIVYCRTGRRSARASEYLAKQGFQVINMTGGITEWNAQKLPVER